MPLPPPNKPVCGLLLFVAVYTFFWFATLFSSNRISIPYVLLSLLCLLFCAMRGAFFAAMYGWLGVSRRVLFSLLFGPLFGIHAWTVAFVRAFSPLPWRFVPFVHMVICCDVALYAIRCGVLTVDACCATLGRPFHLDSIRLPTLPAFLSMPVHAACAFMPHHYLPSFCQPLCYACIPALYRHARAAAAFLPVPLPICACLLCVSVWEASVHLSGRLVAVRTCVETGAVVADWYFTCQCAVAVAFCYFVTCMYFAVAFPQPSAGSLCVCWWTCLPAPCCLLAS